MKKAKVKTHYVNGVIVDYEKYNFFYTREKCNANGHPRYKVFIIDPNGGVVHETILTTYLTINEAVKEFLEEATNND